jgi:hypothetical protein
MHYGYHPGYAAMAARITGMWAATDVDLADFFGVSLTAVRRWYVRHENFRRAVTIGRETADARVERSLFHRAVGYTFDAEKIMICKGVVNRVPYREHVPPDVAACKLWLSRSPGWRNALLDDEGTEENRDLSPEEIKAKIIDRLKVLGVIEDGQVLNGRKGG